MISDPPAYEAFMHRALFDPIRMRSPIPEFDASGTSMARPTASRQPRTSPASACSTSATACGTVARVLPEGWVDHARSPQPDVDDEGWGYGAHWWLLPDRTDGLFFASGYRGQYTIVVPDLDLVVVRSGDSETSSAMRCWARCSR